MPDGEQMEEQIMKRHTARVAVASLVAVLSSLDALAQEAAQVLFSSGALAAIDAAGARRPLRQGDVLRPGDTVVTPPGVLAQIRLPDGAMLSARPDSEVRLDQIGVNVDRTVLQLNQGNIRVLNIDAPAGTNPRPVDVVTPTSTLQLSRGDGESMLVRPGGPAEPGTYNRVQNGEATMRTAGGNLRMQTQQAAFAPRANASPTLVGEMPRSPAMALASTEAPRPRGGQERALPPGASQFTTPAGGDSRPTSLASSAGSAPGVAAGLFNSSMRGGPAPAGGMGGPGSMGGPATPGGMGGPASIGASGALASASSAVGRATSTAVTQVINTTTTNRPVRCTTVRNRRGQDTRVCN